MLNNDGSSSYSDVQKLTFGDDVKKYSIFPNPAKDWVVVKGMNEGSVIRLTNTLGQLVSETKAVSTAQRISTNDLIPASYFIQVLEEGSVVYTVKFVKQ